MQQPYQPTGQPQECSCTGDFWLLHDGRAERDGTNTPPTRATPPFDDQRVAIAMLLAEDKTQENGNRPGLEQTQSTMLQARKRHLQWQSSQSAISQASRSGAWTITCSLPSRKCCRTTQTSALNSGLSLVVVSLSVQQFVDCQFLTTRA